MNNLIQIVNYILCDFKKCRWSKERESKSKIEREKEKKR